LERVERLIDRLPDTLRRTIRWLRRPSSCWVRIPAGLLLIAGSLLSILPFFAVWMPAARADAAGGGCAAAAAGARPPHQPDRAAPAQLVHHQRTHQHTAGIPAFIAPRRQVSIEEEIMKSFVEREKGFEAEFKRNQELGVRSKLVAQGSTEPARVTPIVSMIAVLESSIACLVTFLSPNERMRSARR
jgi:hypothetical protein